MRFLATQPRGEASLTAIAADLSLHVSSVHHLVATLTAAGYLQQNPENRWYRFGGEALWLATSILSQLDVLQAARTSMEEFAAAADEAVTLSVRDEGYALALYRVEPGGSLPGATSGSARRAPLYCTAAGKILCSELPEGKVRELLGLAPMAPRTPRTRTTPEAFLADLEWVRQHGLAVDNEEWTPGIRCVAVPVYNYTGSVVAALTCAGSTGRMEGEHLNQVIDLLREASQTVSQQLGFIRSPK